jgi:UV DNA damage endonuclease
MKIGYPCINNSVGCTANTTFRLASYSEDLLKQKIKNNLECLFKILKYNKENNLMFFRISSDLVPFASHEICKFNWQEYFKKDFKEIGDFIKKNNFRISMHPDQFVLINSPNPNIVKRSIAELDYHADILDLMELDNSAKIQIHVGGVYKDKPNAIKRFIENYNKLPEKIKNRLAIENDDRLFSLKDCIEINKKTKIPIIFDFLHHECLNNNESFEKAIELSSKTWKKKDGILMTDYSSQAPGERKGKHITSVNLKHFKKIISQIKKYDFDIMLEIKDKEKSALIVLKELQKMRKV